MFDLMTFLAMSFDVAVLWAYWENGWKRPRNPFIYMIPSMWFISFQRIFSIVSFYWLNGAMKASHLLTR